MAHETCVIMKDLLTFSDQQKAERVIWYQQAGFIN